MMDSSVRPRNVWIVVLLFVVLCLSRHSASVIKVAVNKVTEPNVSIKDAVDKVTEPNVETKDAVDKVTEPNVETKDVIYNVTEANVEIKIGVNNNPETTVETVDAVNNNPETTVETADAVNNNPENTVETMDAVHNIPETAVITEDAFNNVPETTVGTVDVVSNIPETTVETQNTVNNILKITVGTEDAVNNIELKDEDSSMLKLSNENRENTNFSFPLSVMEEVTSNAGIIQSAATGHSTITVSFTSATTTATEFEEEDKKSNTPTDELFLSSLNISYPTSTQEKQYRNTSSSNLSSGIIKSTESGYDESNSHNNPSSITMDMKQRLENTKISSSNENFSFSTDSLGKKAMTIEREDDVNFKRDIPIVMKSTETSGVNDRKTDTVLTDDLSVTKMANAGTQGSTFLSVGENEISGNTHKKAQTRSNLSNVDNSTELIRMKSYDKSNIYSEEGLQEELITDDEKLTNFTIEVSVNSQKSLTTESPASVAVGEVEVVEPHDEKLLQENDNKGMKINIPSNLNMKPMEDLIILKTTGSGLSFSETTKIVNDIHTTEFPEVILTPSHVLTNLFGEKVTKSENLSSPVNKASTGDNVPVILTDCGSDKTEDFKTTTTEISTTEEDITMINTLQTNFQNKPKTEINFQNNTSERVEIASGQPKEFKPSDVAFPSKNTKSDTQISEKEPAIISGGSLDVSTSLIPNELSQTEGSNFYNLPTKKPETRDEESVSGFATNKDTENINQDKLTAHSKRNSKELLLGRRVPDEEGIKSVIDPNHETFFEIKGNKRQEARTGRKRVMENEFITDDTYRLTESPLSTDDNCPKDCSITKVLDPVCGTNGKVYDSLCFLHKENCGGDVKVGSWEFCRGQHHLCPSTCLDIYEPVCSEDSVIYRNPCIMQRQNCGKEVKIQNLKNCYIRDKEFRNYNPCPQQCLEVYDPTCGSDGRVYFNECFLRKNTCGRGIQVVDMKQCVRVRDCPRICVPFPDVVCGSDGKLYLNECRLLQKNCGKGVKVVPDSFCGKQS
ncbi:uncharacterized protein LOC143230548 [Tachypleus tridentatus]|uniref:uncharacterized protein LOC143230548 n=1 Tax=Tachypleus tridentatus TaxID=6853 RepID=UPI003FCF662D